MPALQKMHYNYILWKSTECSVWGWDLVAVQSECCAVSHIKVDVTLFVLLPSLLLLFTVVKLFAVVVVTNKSRTIVTAEKQNEDGY